MHKCVKISHIDKWVLCYFCGTIHIKRRQTSKEKLRLQTQWINVNDHSEISDGLQNQQGTHLGTLPTLVRLFS